MPYASLNTEIVPNGRIAYRQYKMIKLNRWSAMSPMERSLCVVFNKIERCCGRKRVPGPVQYTCKALFRRVYEINLKKHQSGNKREGLRGPKRDGLIAACLYMAFKTHELYWKKDVVARVFDITSGEIRRGISIFCDLVKDCPLTDNLAKITGCKQYIRWFSVELGLSRSLAKFASLLFKEMKNSGIGSSKQPQSIAAWCIWTICQALRPEITLAELAKVTGKSKATITDVERVTSGCEIPALTSIFALDMCDVCEITNPITKSKIDSVGRAICRTKLKSEFSLWNLAAFSVYFVLTVNDTNFDESNLIYNCQISQVDLYNIAIKFIPYRDAVISECIGAVFFDLQRDSSDLLDVVF
jgi:transcription initiation factor TFIIIB Brf1 subunit/transcription initiation factor TFIIB